MAADRDLVRCLAPEFETTDDAIVDKFICFAQMRIKPGKFPTTINCSGYSELDLAVGYVAAHLLTKAAPPGSGSSTIPGGEVTQEKVGDLSRSYSSTAAGGSSTTDGGGAYNSTRYGREFLQMMKGLIITPMVIC